MKLLATGLLMATLSIVSSRMYGAVADTEAHLARIFQDNMVLQREVSVPVWGWAKPGTDIEVIFDGQKKHTKANKDAYWKIILKPMSAKSQGQNMTVKIGNKSIIRKNILVGEVWIAAGQSNMCAGGPDRDNGLYPFYASSKSTADKPEIRIMQPKVTLSKMPLIDISSESISFRKNKSLWSVLSEDNKIWPVVSGEKPTSLVNIPSQFARVVRDGLNVPVGIIHAAIGGTQQSTWMSRETLEACPGWGKYAKLNGYQQMVQVNTKRSGGKLNLNTPTTHYNTRIHPLAPFAIRGVIWHQGEASIGGPYDKRLVTMTKQWRQLFGQDFYFIWGTLARFAAASPTLSASPRTFYRSGFGIRKALKLFEKDKKVALVELYDLGNYSTHFLQKAESGRRFGLAALNRVYGQKHIYTGPFNTDLKIEGGKAIAKFDHIGKGIVYKPSIEGISGVYVKGKKGPYRWANVKVINPTTIEISHPEIVELKSVSYAMHLNPHETLFNTEGLPASPFSYNTVSDRKKSIDLVTMQHPKNFKATLNFTHVRADGYMFQIFASKFQKNATVTVSAYIPKNWKGYIVEFDGKAIDVKETEKEGMRFVTFKAPVDSKLVTHRPKISGKWIIVAAKGKVDQFRKIDRY